MAGKASGKRPGFCPRTYFFITQLYPPGGAGALDPKRPLRAGLKLKDVASQLFDGVSSANLSKSKDPDHARPIVIARCKALGWRALAQLTGRELTAGMISRLETGESTLSEAEMKRIIDTIWEETPSGGEDDILVFHKDGVPADLHDVEIDALDDVAELLIEKAPVITVFSEQHFGAGHALLELHRHEYFPDFARVVHLRPFVEAPQPEEPVDVRGRPAWRSFRSLLDGLRRVLDLGLGASNSEIIDALDSTRTLLVLHHAHLLDLDDGAPMRRSKHGFAAAGGAISDLRTFIKKILEKPRARSILLLWGPETAIDPWYGSSFDRRRKVVRFAPRLGGGTALDAASAYIKTYVDMLQGRRPNDDSPRMRRLRWHFDFLENREERATGASLATIRLRAAALADHENLSEFDPTQGFRALVGKRLYDELASLRRLEQDVLAALAALTAQELRGLRLGATGVHWFNTGMARRLGDSVPPDFNAGLVELAYGNRPHLCLPSNLDPFGRERRDPHGADRATLLIIPLAVRAIVQDHWKAEPRFDRARVHHAIASQLVEMTAAELPDEYPYDFPQGEPRLVRLSEALRHCVRASEGMAFTHDRETVQDRDGLAALAHALDLPPDGKSDAAATRDAVRAALRRLAASWYHDIEGLAPDQDAQTGAKVTQHTLTRQHGQYYLKLELLGLLSKNGRRSAPLTGLGDKIENSFFREVSICQGALHHMQESLAAAEAGLRDQFPDTKAKADPYGQSCRSNLLLTQAAAMTASLRLQEAKSALDEVDRIARKLEAHVETQDIADPATARARRQCDERRMRLACRRADLHLASGELREALNIYTEEFDKSPRLIVERDQIYGFLETHIAWIQDIRDRQRVEPAASGDAAAPHAKPAKRSAQVSEKAEMRRVTFALIDARRAAAAALAHRSRTHLYHETMRVLALSARLEVLAGDPYTAEVIGQELEADLSRLGGAARTLHDYHVARGETFLALGLPLNAYADHLRQAFRRARNSGAALAARQAARLCRRALAMIAKDLAKEAVVNRQQVLRASWERKGPISAIVSDPPHRSSLMPATHRLSASAAPEDPKDPFWAFETDPEKRFDFACAVLEDPDRYNAAVLEAETWAEKTPIAAPVAGR